MAKTRKPPPLASCYMYPESGKSFVHIVVMKNQRDLRSLARHLKIRGHSKLGGFCHGITGGRRSKLFAMVGLHKGRNGLSPRTVAHEMAHMAMMYLSWVDDVPKDPARSANERLCYLIGDSTADFYKWAKDKKLY